METTNFCLSLARTMATLVSCYKEVCEQRERSKLRNDQMNRDAVRLRNIFFPVNMDKLEKIKRQCLIHKSTSSQNDSHRCLNPWPSQPSTSHSSTTLISSLQNVMKTSVPVIDTPSNGISTQANGFTSPQTSVPTIVASRNVTHTEPALQGIPQAFSIKTTSPLVIGNSVAIDLSPTVSSGGLDLPVQAKELQKQEDLPLLSLESTDETMVKQKHVPFSLTYSAPKHCIPVVSQPMMATGLATITTPKATHDTITREKEHGLSPSTNSVSKHPFPLVSQPVNTVASPAVLTPSTYNFLTTQSEIKTNFSGISSALNNKVENKSNVPQQVLPDSSQLTVSSNSDHMSKERNSPESLLLNEELDEQKPVEDSMVEEEVARNHVGENGHPNESSIETPNKRSSEEVLSQAEGKESAEEATLSLEEESEEEQEEMHVKGENLNKGEDESAITECKEEMKNVEEETRVNGEYVESSCREEWNCNPEFNQEEQEMKENGNVTEDLSVDEEEISQKSGSSEDFWNDLPKTKSREHVEKSKTQQSLEGIKANSDQESMNSSTIDGHQAEEDYPSIVSVLLNAMNTQIRKDRDMAFKVYSQASLKDDMRDQIQDSPVLNSLLIKRARYAQDISSWDTSALSSVLTKVLADIKATQGPASVKDLTRTDTDSLWSNLWLKLLEHVRLLFQCGRSLEELSKVFSRALGVEKSELLHILHHECGVDSSTQDVTVSSLTGSSSSLSLPIHDGNSVSHTSVSTAAAGAYKSFAQSILHSSHNSEQLSSSSEDSEVAALQRYDPTTEREVKQNLVKTEDSDGEEGDNDSPPLPPLDSSSAADHSRSSKPVLDAAAIKRRMGFLDDVSESDLDSHISRPSDNETDEFEFYQ